MTELHFIVSEKNGAWQYSSRGDITSHFGTREEAIAAAIKEARGIGAPEARVIVQDTNMQQQTVWQPADTPPKPTEPIP